MNVLMSPWKPAMQAPRTPDADVPFILVGKQAGFAVCD